MNTEQFTPDSPRLQAAIAELQDLIRHRYPTATFSVDRGEDPAGVYVTVTVDVEDTDDVVDVYIDRLVTLRVEEGLPLHVVPVRPLERVVAQLREEQRSRDRAFALLSR
jgi:hypothetical protein